MEKQSKNIDYDKQFKTKCDSIYKSLEKEFYEVLTKRGNMKKIIDIKNDEAVKRAEALYIGTSGGLIDYNHFKKDLINRFIYNQRVCDTNPIAETINDMVAIKEYYLSYSKQDYDPEFIITATVNEYIDVCAEYQACQRFIELAKPFRDGFDYFTPLNKLCKMKIIDEEFSMSLVSLLKSPDKDEKIIIKLAIYELYILIDMLIQFGSLPTINREDIIDAEKKKKIVYQFICLHFIYKNRIAKNFEEISNTILSKNICDSTEVIFPGSKWKSRYLRFQNKIRKYFPAINLYIPENNG